MRSRIPFVSVLPGAKAGWLLVLLRRFFEIDLGHLRQSPRCDQQQTVSQGESKIIDHFRQIIPAEGAKQTFLLLAR